MATDRNASKFDDSVSLLITGGVAGMCVFGGKVVFVWFAVFTGYERYINMYTANMVKNMVLSVSSAQLAVLFRLLSSGVLGHFCAQNKVAAQNAISAYSIG